jgi:hypothetical protein
VSEQRKSNPVALLIHNPTENLFAYKVKTTAPRQFSVKPCVGTVQPGQTVRGVCVCVCVCVCFADCPKCMP